ncbi:MAG TPA: hypothetical protein VIN08_08165 [Ohtaekwangia sp.]
MQFCVFNLISNSVVSLQRNIAMAGAAWYKFKIKSPQFFLRTFNFPV